MYIANYLMQTESKCHALFIPNMLSDNSQSDSMLEMKECDVYFWFASNNLYSVDQSDMF